MKVEIPPIGLVPLKIHNHQRFIDVSGAIYRYVLANIAVPEEWILELTELNNKIYKTKTKTNR